MKILKELLGLTDPLSLLEANTPIELNTVVTAHRDRKYVDKYIKALWGGKNLVWHGKPFFGDGDLGAAYTEAEKAAEEYIADGYNTDANIDVTFGDNTDTVTWDIDFGKGERQENYLGYDPKRDSLFIGFDTWASEDDFNEAFDKVFEEMTGEEFDADHSEHAAAFDPAWKEYNDGNFGFWGLLFEVTIEDGKMVAEEAYPPMPGGFYRSMYKLFKQQNKHVVDLRLD